MATRPELHEAVAGQKSKASEYNDNFEQIMDFVDNSIDEAKDYVEGFMPAISASTSGKFLSNDGSEANWQGFNLGSGQPFSNIIDGLVINKSSTNVISVSSGCCYDDTGAVILTLASNATKTNDLQSAGTTYYVYIIGNGSSIDILISLSSSSPTLPTGYNYKRLIGYYKTNGSNSIDTTASYGWRTNTAVVEEYNQNDSFYRVYSDKLCVQGGLITTEGTTATVYLLKPYKNNKYNAQVTIATDTGNLYANGVERSASLLYIYSYSGARTRDKLWLTCGYIN